MASPSRYFLVLLSFLIAVQASPVSTQSSLISVRGEPGHPNWGCAFSGNSDLYGLGIRLGIYIQLFSTLLANDLLTVEVQEDAKTTNAIIMIAVFAGMASATWQSNMNSVEIFVMSILLSAFLFGDFSPPHIGRFTLLEGDGTTLYRGLNGFKKTEQQQQQQEGKETKRYFATIARSCFGTAKAVFDVWYWLYGRHVLLRNNIESTVCEPLVFLNTQILLSGYQPIPYVIVAVISAVYEVTFMTWWLFILLPGTFSLLYEVITICFLAIFTYQPSRLGELRERTAHWYLGFARLRPKELRMFDRVRMSKETQKKVRKWIVRLRWLGLPSGYSMVIWTTLAVELTLAWNNVTGVYILGSTGQLIPFVVGVLGLLRNIHLIIVRRSEQVSEKKEPEIKVEWKEGYFVYGSRSGRKLQLEASRPERRWSIDSTSIKSPLHDIPSIASSTNKPPNASRSLTWV